MRKHVSILMTISLAILLAACSNNEDAGSATIAPMDAASEAMEGAGEAATKMATDAIDEVVESVDQEGSGTAELIEAGESMLKDLDQNGIQGEIEGQVDEAAATADKMAEGAMEEAASEADKLKTDAMNKLDLKN